MKLKFNEFTQEVVGKIREFLPETFANAEVDLKVVTKNNNLRLTGLTVKNSDSRIAPTIYLEQFYEKYQEGEEMDEILRKIADFRVKNEAPKDLDTECIRDFGYVKERLVPRLVSRSLNSELLKERPHTVIEDLAVEYYVILGRDATGTAGVAVTNGLMEMWNVSLKEIHAAAVMNLPVIEKSTFQSMAEVLSGVMGDEMFDIFPEDSGMYVLSNTSKVYGAANLLDEKMMAHIYEMLEGEFFIIPSSVHEVLIIGKGLGIDSIALGKMIRDVNSSAVSLEDRLSDHAYTYSLSEGLKIAD